MQAVLLKWSCFSSTNETPGHTHLESVRCPFFCWLGHRSKGLYLKKTETGWFWLEIQEALNPASTYQHAQQDPEPLVAGEEHARLDPTHQMGRHRPPVGEQVPPPSRPALLVWASPAFSTPQFSHLLCEGQTIQIQLSNNKMLILSGTTMRSGWTLRVTGRIRNDTACDSWEKGKAKLPYFFFSYPA